MKWNWGTKLMLVFSFFASAMILLVIMSMRQKVQMVAKDYYKDELRYQQVIDASNLANGLTEKVRVIKQDSFITIQLPHEMKGRKITGKLLFYCASESAKDKVVVMQTDVSGKQEVPASKFSEGNYTVKIEWECDGKQYYAEQFITL